jgi:hypothetical protein
VRYRELSEANLHLWLMVACYLFPIAALGAIFLFNVTAGRPTWRRESRPLAAEEKSEGA